MSDVVITKKKRSMHSDEVFVKCWQKHSGNVELVALELGIKPISARSRATKYINAGVNLIPPQKKSRKIEDRVSRLNGLLV